MPEISVILPHYGHHAYVHDAIDSIVNQSFQDWELLILNDDPGFDLSYYMNYDDRIKCFGAPRRQGQPYQLNKGIYFARGKYIAFQDADDVSFPKRLEMSLNHLKNRDADAITADSIYMDFGGKRHYTKCSAPTRETIKIKSVGNFGSTLIKKSIAEKIPFDVKVGYGNDYIWWIGILSLTENIHHMPIPVYYYRHYATTFWNHKIRKIPIVRKIYRISKNRKLQKRVNAELIKRGL